MRCGLQFSSDKLEAQYRQRRLKELAKSDLIKLPLAYLMNLMFNATMLGSRRGVGASLAYSGVLVFQTACILLLAPATYAKYKPVISSLCRLGWHASTIWGLPEWIQPLRDTFPSFLKLLLMASGIMALNWLLPFTLTGSLATDILLQLAAAPCYVVWFAPNHTCRHIVAAPSQLSCLERLWGGINSMTASFAQVLMLPLLPTSFSKFTPMQACVQAVVMLQLLLGVALPCIGLVLADSAARRRFLSSVWQQQGWTALQHVMLLEDSVSGGTPGTTSPQQQQEEGESSTSPAGSAAAQAGDAGGSSPSSHSSSMSSMAALDGAGVPLDSPADFHINLPGVIACLLVLVVGAWQLLQDVSVWVGLGLPA